MIETGKPLAHPSKKPSLTPKAIIHQNFGSKASYSVEEVQDLPDNVCPGLAISQKGPCLYRCTLQLPEFSVISGTFRRKKDAEQSAAEKAIEKLGIRQEEYNPTVEEAWDDLANRIAYLFADEFLLSLHPLSGHFKATLRREGHFNGCVPVPVIAAYDAKLSNICKYIENEAEVNSRVVISLILKAAAKLTDVVLIPDEQLALKRRSEYHPDIISSINLESTLCENTLIEAVFIPASFDKAVEPLIVNVAATGYYLDAVACLLGMKEASDLLISRTIGKASSELRIYFSAPKRQVLDQLSVWEGEQTSHFEGSFNARASYFAGQKVYGDAILASVGYTWKSTDLFHEVVSLRSYYRILVSMGPSGIYKISREAILASKLPSTFTTKCNWKGSLPRDILCAFCRFHHLSEPVFSTHSKLLGHSLGSPGSKKLKVMESSEEAKCGSGVAAAHGNKVESVELFNCDVKVYTKKQKLILQCAPQESHRKQTDAMQSSALKVLSWLNIIFEEPDISLDKLGLLADKSNILFTPQYYFEVFALCRSIHNIGIKRGQGCGDNAAEGDDLTLIDLAGKSSGVAPSNGSVACISYTVLLFGEDVHVKEHLESCEEFEFEMGGGAVLPQLESAVAQMSVGQSAYFQSDVPPTEFILAAAEDPATTLSILSSCNCKLEYCITLLQVTEPLEDRMEQALFSPPLSKQRVEFALQHIKESSAVSLVDFGCGSGSLLDSLLSYPTLLEKVVGVDLSQRSLARAAKSLHSKLNRSDSKDPSNKLKTAALYYGNITNFDSRLHGFDIGTCLEVIEHMEEEDAHLFGDIVLRCFCPRILIVSTPNYEYNVILQQSTPPNGQEDNPDQVQACKFRNHDHKFEWTRAEFNKWASELAARHNYTMELSGVGGDGNMDPGFASQIAIFRRHEDDLMKREEQEMELYVPIWEWCREDDAS